LDVTLAARPSTEERATAQTRGVQLGIRGSTVDETIAKEMNLLEAGCFGGEEPQPG
jgi:hypothetical protein